MKRYSDFFFEYIGKMKIEYWNSAKNEVEIVEIEKNHLMIDEEEYVILYPKSQSRKTIWKYPSNYFESHSIFHRKDACPGIVQKLVRRFTNVQENWKNKSLQSVLECGGWMLMTLASWQLWEGKWFAVVFGVLLGGCMSIVNEVIQHRIKGGHRKENLAITVLLGYIGMELMMRMVQYALNRNSVVYLVGVVWVGSGMLVLANWGQCWKHVKHVAMECQNRWTRFGYNWRKHTLRSMMEWCLWSFMIFKFAFVEGNVSSIVFSILNFGILLIVLERIAIVGCKSMCSLRQEEHMIGINWMGEALMWAGDAVANRTAFGRMFESTA